MVARADRGAAWTLTVGCGGHEEDEGPPADAARTRVLQSYSEIYKLLRKGAVTPDTASWIFTTTPSVVFATALTAGMLVPMFAAEAPLAMFGGVLAFVYLLGMGRFFLALAGLDTGSSFGGLGSSREMTVRRWPSRP